MSDTPRADASYDAWHGNAPRDNIWQLARDMERELIAARARIAELEAANTRMWSDYQEKREQLEAAQKELEAAKETSECRCATAAAVSLDLDECRRELDECRKQRDANEKDSQFWHQEALEQREAARKP